MDEKKLISQLYCKIRNDNKTSKSIINDSYRKLKHNLCKIYKTMDVDFDSEMLKVMDEVMLAEYNEIRGHTIRYCRPDVTR